MKKFITYLILTGFIFVMTPAVYWHHCDEGNTTQHPAHHKKGVTLEKSSCEICHLQLFAAEVPHTLVFKFSKNVCYPQAIAATQVAHARHTATSLRGPPLV